MGRIFLLLVVIVGGLFWWLMLDARAPKTAPDEFDLTAWRALVDADGGAASDLRIEIVGRDEAPMYAAEAGGGLGQWPLYYAAVQAISDQGVTIIGGAADDLTADEIAQSKIATFDDAAYRRLLAGLSAADGVYITHEHLDHVMAITRHPNPESVADALRLTAPQIAALPKFAAPGEALPTALADLSPVAIDAPTLVAPGIVAAPAPGHTPGSLVFYIRRDDGAEYLLIGDIVWVMSNIEDLKTRPRLLQYLFFDPDEDRKAILRQVRALHVLSESAPELNIVPNHDGAHIDGLIRAGLLTEGFAQSRPAPDAPLTE